MLAQYLFVGLVIAGAVAYAVWRAYARIKHPSRCRGCVLSAQCGKQVKADRPIRSCSQLRKKANGNY